MKNKKWFMEKLGFFVIAFGIYFPMAFGATSFYFTKMVISSWLPESYTEYKLKFVSSENFDDASNKFLGISPPVEVLSTREESGVLYVKTHYGSAVTMPLTSTVYVKIGDNGEKQIETTYLNIKLIMFGFDCIGVSDGEKVKRNAVIGTLKTDELCLIVYQGKNILPLKILEKMFL